MLFVAWHAEILRHVIYIAAASRSSRRSSFTSDACSTSNTDHVLVTHKAVADVEAQAKNLGRSVDKMLSDLQTNLHNVSCL